MKLQDKLVALLLSAAIIMNMGFTAVFAEPGGQTGDFTVTGGTLGTSHKYENNTLTIMDSTALTISGTTTADKIVVQSGVTANITLDNVNIDVSSISDACAFDITGATANLALKAGTTNTLKSGNGKAGLNVPTGATLTIGGTGALAATGGYDSAGIGGGYSVAVGTVEINGGTVTATGSYSGAGIGGGFYGTGGTVKITAGTVTATGGSAAAAGIGGGSEGAAGTFSTGTGGNAFIVASSIADKTGQGLWNGVIIEGDTGSVYGAPTLTTDAEIPSGKTLTVEDGKTLTIAAGATLTNNGTLTNSGTVTNNGTIINNGIIDGTAIAGNAPVEKSATTVTFAIKGAEGTPVTAAEYGQTIVITATAKKNNTGMLPLLAGEGKVDFYLGGIDGGTKLNTTPITATENGGVYKATLEITLADSKWTPSDTPYTITADFGGVAGLQASTGTGSLTVNKCSRTIPAPTVDNKTETSVTLKGVAPSIGSGDGTVEYGYAATNNSADVAHWQTGLAFGGLKSGITKYYFARVTGGTNYADVTSATGTAVKTPLTEQFNLYPGGMYYFDLSGTGVAGTICSDLPDTTLHYVPFIYAGAVNAYSLGASSSGNSGASTAATPYIHSLFISYFNVSHVVSWNKLNEANLIFGKNYTGGGIGYTLRAPSAGNSTANSPNTNQSGIPISNEWDSLYDKSIGNINKYDFKYSWGQDTYTTFNWYRAVRGYNNPNDWYSKASDSHINADCGWRPVLEVMNPSSLTADGLKPITLKLNGGKLGMNTADLRIIVKNNTNYTAPSKEGLTAPSGKQFIGWNTAQDGSGKSYAAGSSVPFSARTLYAQWATPQESKPTPRIDYTTAKLTGLVAGAAYSITPADGSAQAKNADANGMLDIDSTWFGKTVDIVKKGVSGGSLDSEAQSLSIPVRPATPTGLMNIQKARDSIVIVNADQLFSGCEFSKNGMAWSTNATLSGLTAGTEYTISARIKAVAGTSFASEAKTVKVTTVAADGSTTLKPYESVKVESGEELIINSGNKTAGIDSDKRPESLETVITLPSDDIEVLPNSKIRVPEGGTVSSNGGPTVTLPGGGTVDKGGNTSVTSPETIIIGDTTIAPPASGTITTDKNGKTELPAGSTVTSGDTTVTISGGTSGSSVDKDGNIKLPSGGEVTIKGKGGSSSTVTVPDAGGEIGVKDDGSVSVPGGSTVKTPSGDTVTVPDGGGVIGGDGKLLIPVTKLTITSSNSVVANEELTLTATVEPSGATNKTIVWTVSNDGGTGATITGGNIFKATAKGVARIMATIKNGASAATDFTMEFSITVKGADEAYPIAVSGSSDFVVNKANDPLIVTIGTGITGFNATNNFEHATLGGVRLDLGAINGAAGADGSVKDGSIIITVNIDRLNKLGVGSHELVVTLKNGATITTAVTVKAASGDNPYTGDNSGVIMWSAVLLLSCGALAGTIIIKKRKNK